MKTEEMDPTYPADRRFDIDWLRFIAVLLLIPFHGALIFVLNPHVIMYIKDSVNSVVLDRWAGWIHQFHMPLLFLISGASSFYALKRRTRWVYLGERVTRLFVPAVFGIAVLIPPMTYITRIADGSAPDFWRHYAGFWHMNPQDPVGFTGSFTPGHLWFLIYLFAFSLLALPIFMLLKRESSHVWLEKAAALCAPRACIYLLAIPLAWVAAIEPYNDKNPFYYFAIYFLGYMLMTDSRYQFAIARDAPIALILAILCELVRQNWHPHVALWSPVWIAKGLLEQLGRWVWLLAILGYGRRWLNHDSRILNYLTLATFPFYLFHLLAVTAVGYLVIRLPMGIAGKYAIIVFLSTIATWAVYEIIRWIPVLNFLCGIKPRRPKTISSKPVADDRSGE